MKKPSLDRYLATLPLTLTDLRKDVFGILYKQDKPMGAYDVLHELKKKRPKAEPPTVYRVLEYLVEQHLIHCLEAQHRYVCCAHPAQKVKAHQAILLSCEKCKKSFEHEAAGVFKALRAFAKQYHMTMNDTMIEMRGICPLCS